ncbi:MAG: hypothetical protein ACXW36_08760 [Nitrospira sp.]
MRANTLIVDMGGTTVSLRPFYNAAERYYRAEHKRFDYPSCAPHATQAWIDYVHWLDALVTLSEQELDLLQDRVNCFVLERLQSQAFDPATVSLEPPLFRLLLEDFDMTSRKGEPTGATFQAPYSGFFVPITHICKSKSTRFAPAQSGYNAWGTLMVGREVASPYRQR